MRCSLQPLRRGRGDVGCRRGRGHGAGWEWSCFPLTLYDASLQKGLLTKAQKTILGFSSGAFCLLLGFPNCRQRCSLQRQMSHNHYLAAYSEAHKGIKIKKRNGCANSSLAGSSTSVGNVFLGKFLNQSCSQPPGGTFAKKPATS